MENNKKPMIGKFSKAFKVTAATLGMIVSVQSFAQENCEDSGGYDDDCIVDLDPIGVGGSGGGSGGGAWWDNPGYWGGGYSGGGSSSGGSSGGGGGGGGTMTIHNNPNNPSPTTNCGDAQGVRQAYARSDIGYAWNARNQKPRVGSRVRINYRNNTSELFIFNGMLAPLTPIPGSCG